MYVAHDVICMSSGGTKWLGIGKKIKWKGFLYRQDLVDEFVWICNVHSIENVQRREVLKFKLIQLLCFVHVCVL
jgi:hypothetical protein